MTYEEFLEFIPAKCMYETIYDDSDGRTILVIRLLDAYSMVNKMVAVERERILDICKEGLWDAEGIRYHLDNQERGNP